MPEFRHSLASSSQQPHLPRLPLRGRCPEGAEGVTLCLAPSPRELSHHSANADDETEGVALFHAISPEILPLLIGFSRRIHADGVRYACKRRKQLTLHNFFIFSHLGKASPPRRGFVLFSFCPPQKNFPSPPHKHFYFYCNLKQFMIE